MRIHVAKFGGTSMGSAEAMRQAAKVVNADQHSRFVVVSATSGTTNLLLAAQRSALEGNEAAVSDAVGGIERRHLELADQLQVSETSRHHLEMLFVELHSILRSSSLAADATLDQLLSLGERLSSVLFTEVLRRSGRNTICLDARELLRTDSRFGKAEPQLAEIRALCGRLLPPLLESGSTIVTQGFIGSDATGATTTLGRGGSDYSAALFAEAMGATECLIWTDVNGIYSMDPRTVPSAQVIQDISFAEAAELASFGAKVLHPATLLPAMRSGTKVFVGNTFAPEQGGTWIHRDLESRPLFRAIAVRDKQTLITVTSMRMLNVHGFLAKLFTLLADHGLSVDLVTTSEVSVALTIDGTSTGSSGRSILENEALLQQLREIAEVQVEENLGLVALIGSNLTTTAGVGSRCLQAAGETNVRLICHGASPNNFCFLVKGNEAKAVAARLHEEFL